MGHSTKNFAQNLRQPDWAIALIENYSEIILLSRKGRIKDALKEGGGSCGEWHYKADHTLVLPCSIKNIKIKLMNYTNQGTVSSS